LQLLEFFILEVADHLPHVFFSDSIALSPLPPIVHLCICPESHKQTQANPPGEYTLPAFSSPTVEPFAQ